MKSNFVTNNTSSSLALLLCLILQKRIRGWGGLKPQLKVYWLRHCGRISKIYYRVLSGYGRIVKFDVRPNPNENTFSKIKMHKNFVSGYNAKGCNFLWKNEKGRYSRWVKRDFKLGHATRNYKFASLN